MYMRRAWLCCSLSWAGLFLITLKSRPNFLVIRMNNGRAWLIGIFWCAVRFLLVLKALWTSLSWASSMGGLGWFVVSGGLDDFSLQNVIITSLSSSWTHECLLHPWLFQLVEVHSDIVIGRFVQLAHLNSQLGTTFCQDGLCFLFHIGSHWLGKLINIFFHQRVMLNQYNLVILRMKL